MSTSTNINNNSANHHNLCSFSSTTNKTSEVKNINDPSAINDSFNNMNVFLPQISANVYDHFIPSIQDGIAIAPTKSTIEAIEHNISAIINDNMLATAHVQTIINESIKIIRDMNKTINKVHDGAAVYSSLNSTNTDFNAKYTNIMSIVTVIMDLLPIINNTTKVVAEVSEIEQEVLKIMNVIAANYGKLSDVTKNIQNQQYQDALDAWKKSQKAQSGIGICEGILELVYSSYLIINPSAGPARKAAAVAIFADGIARLSAGSAIISNPDQNGTKDSAWNNFQQNGVAAIFGQASDQISQIMGMATMFLTLGTGTIKSVAQTVKDVKSAVTDVRQIVGEVRSIATKLKTAGLTVYSTVNLGVTLSGDVKTAITSFHDAKPTENSPQLSDDQAMSLGVLVTLVHYSIKASALPDKIENSDSGAAEYSQLIEMISAFTLMLASNGITIKLNNALAKNALNGSVIEQYVPTFESSMQAFMLYSTLHQANSAILRAEYAAAEIPITKQEANITMVSSIETIDQDIIKSVNKSYNNIATDIAQNVTSITSNAQTAMKALMQILAHNAPH